MTSKRNLTPPQSATVVSNDTPSYKEALSLIADLNTSMLNSPTVAIQSAPAIIRDYHMQLNKAEYAIIDRILASEMTGYRATVVANYIRERLDATKSLSDYTNKLIALEKAEAELDAGEENDYDNAGHTDELDQSKLPNANITLPAPVPVALIIGHTAKAGGAYSPVLDSNEYDFYTMVTDWIQDTYRDNLVCIKRNGGQFYHYRYEIFNRNEGGISGAYQRADNWLYKQQNFAAGITIELHFNGSTDEKINYSTTLAYENSKNALAVSKAFESRYAELSGIRSVGARTVGRYDRGGYNLTRSRYPSILIEPFFGSHNLLSLRNFNDNLLQAIGAATDAIRHKLG